MAGKFNGLGLFMAFLASSFLLVTGTTFAQDKVVSAEELSLIEAMLSDPDSNVRIENLSQILAESKATKTERALRIALSSADQEMRTIALRHYLGTYKYFAISLSPTERDKKLFEKVQDDENELANFINMNATYYLFYPDWELPFRISEFKVESGQGIAFMMAGVDKPDENYPGELQTKGDRIWFSARLPKRDDYVCTVDLRPTQELTLSGTVSCVSSNYKTGKLPAVANMF